MYGISQFSGFSNKASSTGKKNLSPEHQSNHNKLFVIWNFEILKLICNPVSSTYIIFRIQNIFSIKSKSKTSSEIQMNSYDTPSEKSQSN